MPSSQRTLAVLASGTGSNFEALALAERAGATGAGAGLGGRIVVLASDRAEARALDRARGLGIEALVLPAGPKRTRVEDESAWVEALKARGVEVLLLAGFMRRLHSILLGAFPDAILNIHPSLLPAFSGLDAIRRALEAGERETGCTVHLVDEGLDSGPILAQAPVEIRKDDTLASLEARVHEAEHRLYPETVRRFLTEPWRREGGRIVFGTSAGVPRG